MDGLPLNQIALSVTDVQRTHRWYRDVFGFLPAGGTYTFTGLLPSKVQGLPGASSVCWWLNDQQDFFQLELFEFSSPRVRPLPEDWRPCDIGYTTIGLHVADLDATLDRLARRHGAPLTDPIGEPGRRRVAIRDPEGILLELLEDDPRGPDRRARPRPHVPVVTRFVTLSVPDLARARHTWIDVLGLPEATDVVLHRPEHEALWGLAGASRRSFCAWAGDVLIEVVEYDDPRGAPWPADYRISDQGLLNIAFGFRDRSALDAMIRRCQSGGLRPNWNKLSVAGLWEVVYVDDELGFSIELLYVRDLPRLPLRINEIELGFAPKSPPIQHVSASTTVRVPPEVVWDALADVEGMAAWSPYRRTAVLESGVDGGLLGQRRRLSSGPGGMAVTEDIVVVEAPHRLEYRVVEGFGVRFTHGFVTLDDDPDGGTRVTWEVQLRPRVPGATAVTQRIVDDLVAGLARRVDAAVSEEV